MTIRKFTKKIHKWLGLVSGIVVFIVSISGCIYCFHDEIKDVTGSNYRIVEPRNLPYIKPSLLKQEVQQLSPDYKIDKISYYGCNRSSIVSVQFNEEKYFLYFNPYDGTLLKKEIRGKDFFDIILRLHKTLLLPRAIGSQVVGISTFIFVVLILSGLILWLPKKGLQMRSGFTIKWNAKIKRINYNWHKTIGFYIAIFSLFIAISGLVSSYL